MIKSVRKKHSRVKSYRLLYNKNIRSFINMPCRVYEPYYSEEELAYSRNLGKWNNIADNFTHTLDESREILLENKKIDTETLSYIESSVKFLEETVFTEKEDLSKNKISKRLVREGKDVLHGDKQVTSKGKLLKTVKTKIERAQIQHRKEDLTRVIHYYTDRFNFEEVSRVAQVDTTKPIIEQLGYDPDDIG